MSMLRYYQYPGLSRNHANALEVKIGAHINCDNVQVLTEYCYNIGLLSKLSEVQNQRLKWLIAPTFAENSLSELSCLESKHKTLKNSLLLEFGPRLNFATAYSTNAVSICQEIDVRPTYRIERSRKYLIIVTDKSVFTKLNEIIAAIHHLFHDRMTEVEYLCSLKSFEIAQKPEEIYEVDLLEHGKKALVEASFKMGLAFDDWDVEYYWQLFSNKLRRNPTNVECFDLAQSNSEHSRHWFFKGKIVIDGEVKVKSLMELVMDTQKHSNKNNVIKFSDNSSAIVGFSVKTLVPKHPTGASLYCKEVVQRHILFTAETHNFPTGVCPFSGAATGTGGRIRDTHATGRGSNVIAATVGYCFGNLHLPGYVLPWEATMEHPSDFACPLDVIIEASNGASDYGNKFGEPVICGFARSFGMKLGSGERREWIKPIMFSGGLGSIDQEHLKKKPAEKGMKVVKVGGPVYRIGVGGGAASSIQVQGDNAEHLDFGAVQRGDPEMGQKLNRFIRACIEMGVHNPICSIHDQGAGGNGNVLKELCEPAGAIIQAGDFQLGDPTLSVLEIWGAEYQESDAILIKKEDATILKKISQRERVNVSFVGDITGDGKIVLEDRRQDVDASTSLTCKRKPVVDLPLDIVLGKMPQKMYQMRRTVSDLVPLRLPSEMTVYSALDRVLRLPTVASKRYLTNKVDRSVTGLVAQQQCVGPLHTPLSNMGVVALSHFETVGSATAIGEQPIKMLINAAKGARLVVAEAFTNLMFAKVSDIKDIKCSGNWMWPAKLPGEGAKLYDACSAMSSMLSLLGAAIDGGKDSLSMAVRVKEDVVKAPGSLVLSVYAPCPDVRLTVTPDLKMIGSSLLYVNMSGSEEWILGGSALAQVFNQIGDDVPDIIDMKLFADTFNIIQEGLQSRFILSGHDVSDGGVITTLLEMSFAGNLGISINLDCILKNDNESLRFLFSEHPGAILEVASDQLDIVQTVFSAAKLSIHNIGVVCADKEVTVVHKNRELLKCGVNNLREIWEATSFQLERQQCNRDCVFSEEKNLNLRLFPNYTQFYNLRLPTSVELVSDKPKVAVVREEGSNGDREMVSCLYLAGFEVFDVTMQDLCEGSISLKEFHGVVFVGGFSYGDVFGSAKGWASLAKFNETAFHELSSFRNRLDTFSLGVCNGCQLMALMGWVGNDQGGQGVCFTQNKSERFESRYVNVKILNSSSIMLKNMEDYMLGVWIAHGEGRVVEKEAGFLDREMKLGLAPIRYVDDNGSITTSYPLNPNGSIEGIAALCSNDGRHLAMMPHPERSFLTWQLPWVPHTWKAEKYTPWMQMFLNARWWCKTGSFTE